MKNENVKAVRALFASVKAAAKAQGIADARSSGAIRYNVVAAIMTRDVPTAADFIAGGKAAKTAEVYVSHLNTIRVLSGHIATENRETEAEALLVAGFSDYGKAVELLRDAIAGKVGSKPGEVLCGSGATRAVLDTVAKPKAGAVAAIVKARADKASAEKKAKEAAPAGEPAASAPAGKAEPSAAQKLAPRAQFQAARAALFDSLNRGKWVDVGKVEKQVALLTATLAAIEANLKDK